jgi:hypothetical protein
LLKLFFAVTHAIFVARINFVSSSGGLRVAGKHLGANGGANHVSRLWHHLRCA